MKTTAQPKRKLSVKEKNADYMHSHDGSFNSMTPADYLELNEWFTEGLDQ